MVKSKRVGEDVYQTGYSNDERKGIQLSGLLCIAVGALEVIALLGAVVVFHFLAVNHRRNHIFLCTNNCGGMVGRQV